MGRPSGSIDEPVNSLSQLRVSEQTIDTLLAQIGRLALRARPDWDAVGTTLVKRDKVSSFGITDARIERIDQAQYDHGGGPCIDAARTGTMQYFDGNTDKTMWHQFAETAAVLGIHCVASFPLIARDETIGAMNFYSRRPHVLGQQERDAASAFAREAAIAVLNVGDLIEGRKHIEQLTQVLETRTQIGQATGLLMGQGLTSEEAFRHLVVVSQHANVKVREIARRYVVVM